MAAKSTERRAICSNEDGHEGEIWIAINNLRVASQNLAALSNPQSGVEGVSVLRRQMFP